MYPVPQTSYTAGLTIFYSASTDEITSIGNVLEVPDPYFNAVVSYCMWKAYEMDDNFSSAEVMQRQFYESVTKLANRTVSHDNRYPTITLLPEDYYY